MRNLFIILVFALNALVFCQQTRAESSLDEFMTFKSPQETALIKNPETESENALPFQTDIRQTSDNELTVSFKIEKGSYIYQDSLKFASKAHFENPTLPKAQTHSDATGTHLVYKDSFDLQIKIKSCTQKDDFTVSYQGCDEKGICYPPKSQSFALDNIKAAISADSGTGITLLSDKENASFSDSIYSTSLALSLLTCLILGMALNLTPCVLPMLSIYSAMLLGTTRSFRHTLMTNLAYLLGLACTFTLIGLLFAAAGSHAQELLQSAPAKILMAALFVIFALDCAEIITLKIPQFLNAKIESTVASQKRGTLRQALIFGALSALIATPCTSAPLVGALIYITQLGDLLRGTLMFLCIGLGLGIPLILIGLFGSRILPKPGPVSVLIKKCLAVPLILAGWYFVSHLVSVRTALTVETALTFCLTAYLLMCLLNYKGIKLKAAALVGVLALSSATAYSYYRFIAYEETILPFTEIKITEELDRYKGEKVLITFSAAWCHNCHALDKELYATEDFKKTFSEYRLLRFDMTDISSSESLKFADKFKIIGVPFVLVLNEKGEAISSYGGILNLEQLKSLALKQRH